MRAYTVFYTMFYRSITFVYKNLQRKDKKTEVIRRYRKKKELKKQKRVDEEKQKCEELMRLMKEQDRLLYANELDKYISLSEKYEGVD